MRSLARLLLALAAHVWLHVQLARRVQTDAMALRAEVGRRVHDLELAVAARDLAAAEAEARCRRAIADLRAEVEARIPNATLVPRRRIRIRARTAQSDALA